MYSSEYVNSLIEEIELLKRQKQELIKGGEILRNKYNKLKEENLNKKELETIIDWYWIKEDYWDLTIEDDIVINKIKKLHSRY
jgi:hypothetical protein